VRGQLLPTAPLAEGRRCDGRPAQKEDEFSGFARETQRERGHGSVPSDLFIARRVSYPAPPPAMEWRSFEGQNNPTTERRSSAAPRATGTTTGEARTTVRTNNLPGATLTFCTTPFRPHASPPQRERERESKRESSRTLTAVSSHDILSFYHLSPAARDTGPSPCRCRRAHEPTSRSDETVNRTCLPRASGRDST